jgi:glycine betaine/proline transport system permease protein
VSHWLYGFPQIDSDTLFQIKHRIDEGFRAFTSAYGDAISALFQPLDHFLIGVDWLLTNTPWPIVILVFAGLVWLATHAWRLVVMTIIIFVLIGLFGMWDNTMLTVAMIVVATTLSIVFGIPIGIAMSRSNVLQRIINPILDVMQTMPSFVYLIPVVMLLGIGRVPGLIAVVIYAIPPVIRLTNLGIRLVDRDILEATDAFGSSRWQTLVNVQLPLALPTIMAGINQTIMMALAMVVIAAMIGVEGLGQPVLQAIANQYFTLGVFNGLAIVGIAIVLDRASQAYGRRLQKHIDAHHG